MILVVRQALLQNQAPEIQQKLLAMQKQIQQQNQPLGASPITSSSIGTGTTVKRTILPSSTPPTNRSVLAQNLTSSTEVRMKTKTLTQEQKEEQSR